MPQSQTQSVSEHPNQSLSHSLRAPIQIAQGGMKTPTPGAPEVGREVVAESKAGESGKHEAGEVPAADLLFYNSALVALLMVVFALVARRELQKIPRGLQNVAEWAVESLNNFTVGIVGPGGERYTPLVGTIFIYILLMNLIGIFPGFHSPTANISITLALGVVVFCYVQYEGIRQNGLGGHFKHFMGPMPALAPLMLPVELISEIVKPFTLAVRLFGNIFGEDVIIVVLAGLAGTLGGQYLSFIPLQFPVLLLSILTAVVQALVFSMLTCIYLSLVSHHEHEGEHGEEGAIDGSHAHASAH